jgi:hypothetical protein
MKSVKNFRYVEKTSAECNEDSYLAILHLSRVELCPKKVRHAIFMIANQMKKQLEKLWFWVTSIVELKKDTE